VVSAVSPSSRPAEPGSGTSDLPVSLVIATSEREIALHHRIRRAVFVDEQGMFEETDVDAHDGEPATLKVLASCGSVPAGAVRLYPLDDEGLWKGDRLAVLSAFRPRGLGAPLVRFAVRTAGERGGRLMVAHIQPRNVGFFRRLGWHMVGEPEIFVGREHQKMAIRLDAEA
jgi:putative N-acetyltransferase (TIGR04045 family)